MAINYLIGVGGVGSRIIESVVRLCECGFITEGELNCLMVDVDEHNGTASNTLDAITNYRFCRDILKSDTIFKTEIKPVHGRYRISPLEEVTSTTINSIASSSRDMSDQNIAQVLFDKNEAAEKVDAGFYGNLALGNAFYTYAVESKGINSPLHKLLKKITDDTSTSIVKVYVVGSLFGGTGASGMAFICKQLVEMFKKEDMDRRSKLHIQACLMLPYFRYHDNVTLTPDRDGKIPEQKINHANFKKNALAALEKYERLGKVFDKVLMLGDTDLPVRGMYSEEGSRQKNWPHLLEFFAAAEAGKFFNIPEASLPSDGYGNTDWYANPFRVNGTSEKSTPYNIECIDWSDYDDHMSLKKKLEDFLLLNYYYSMYIVPTLFDYSGGQLRSWNFTSDDEATDDRKDDMPEWALSRFVKWERVILRKHPKRWFNGIAVDKFNLLYKYFTESAQWYYTMAYDYGETGEGDRPCWEAGEIPACAGSPDCQRVRTPLFPKIFQGNGGNGVKVLSERACMPRREFRKYLSGAGKVHSDVGRTSPNLDERLQAVEGSDGEERQNVMFVELINELYKRVAATTLGIVGNK